MHTIPAFRAFLGSGRGGTPSLYYENMRQVASGDLVFSFRDRVIRAIGVARSYCYDAPKPAEFGRIGDLWDDAGWRVDVEFLELGHPVRPIDHIDSIRPLLPAKYSPLQSNGDGVQAYLLPVPDPLADALTGLLVAAGNLPPAPAAPDRTDSPRAIEIVT